MKTKLKCLIFALAFFTLTVVPPVNAAREESITDPYIVNIILTPHPKVRYISSVCYMLPETPNELSTMSPQRVVDDLTFFAEVNVPPGVSNEDILARKFYSSTDGRYFVCYSYLDD